MITKYFLFEMFFFFEGAIDGWIIVVSVMFFKGINNLPQRWILSLDILRSSLRNCTAINCLYERLSGRDCLCEELSLRGIVSERNCSSSVKLLANNFQDT